MLTLLILLLLTPCLTHAQDNLARAATSSQSSVYGNGYESPNAIDGDTSSRNPALTKRQLTQWWQLALDQPAYIEYVNLWNHNRYTYRFANFDVLIADSPFPSGDLTASRAHAHTAIHRGPDVAHPTRIDVGKQGQYIRIQRTDTEYLQVQEVEVFGRSGGGPGIPGVSKIKLGIELVTPTTNEDGTPLEDLSHLMVYVCDEDMRGDDETVILCDDPHRLSLRFDKDTTWPQTVDIPVSGTSGTVWLTATAVDTSGNESRYSNIVTHDWQIKTPDMPELSADRVELWVDEKMVCSAELK